MLPASQTISPEIRPAKRKRVVLSVETKLQMIERAMNGEKFSKLSREYNISPQTAKDIFNNRDKLVSFAFSSGTVGSSLKRKSLKRSSFQDIDKAVFQWFQQQRSEGIPITGPMLIEKALWFHKEMKISEPFLASSGWLSNFKTRYNIRQPKTKDDKLVAEEPIVDKFKTEFKQIVKQNNFTIDQIYLGDEKTLYWRNLPKINVHDDVKVKTENDVTNEEEYITIMASANANGSKKLKLFCTGKYEIIINSNYYNSTLVNYYNVKKDENSYEDVLKDWFNNVFIPEVKEDLKEKALPEKAVLLIINSNNEDSESDSTKIDYEVEIKSDDGNFSIMSLPKNISQLPQMGQITKDIIKYYFKRKLIPMLEDGIKNEYFSTNLSLNDTFHVIAEAWNNVNNEHMQHSSWWWRNLFAEMENEGIIEPGEGIITHFMMTRDNIKAEECEVANKDISNDMSDRLTNYNNLNNNLSLSSLHGIIKREAEPEGQLLIDKHDEFSTASSSQSKIITINEAFNSAGILLTYLEQQDDSSYKDLVSVRNVKKKLKEKLSNIFLNGL